MDDPQYEQKYVAFVDIIGFRELISKLDVGNTPLGALRDLLKNIHAPVRAPSSIAKVADFRAQSISDAVAMSASVTPEGLLHIFYSIEGLAFDLLQKGFFIRGAVVKGNVYHDDEMVFGKALLHAYQLESEVVRFPRVMITRDIVKDIEKYSQHPSWGSNFKDRLNQSDDGPFFLNVLREIAEDIRRELERDSRVTAEEDDMLRMYGDIGKQIQRRFNDAIDNPNHFEKVQWFAAYWNRTIPKGVVGLNHIEGPGVTPRYWKS